MATFIKSIPLLRRPYHVETCRMELHGSVLLPFLNHIRQNAEMIIAYEKRIMMRRGMIETDYCRRPTFAADPVFDSMFDEFYEMTLPYLKKQLRESDYLDRPESRLICKVVCVLCLTRICPIYFGNARTSALQE